MDVAPSDLLLALHIAGKHEKKLEDQKLLALSIIDWAIYQSDKVGAADREQTARARLTKR